MKPILVFFTFLLVACNQPHHKTPTIAPPVKQILKPIDTTIYTVLKLDKGTERLFDKGTKPSSISSKEISKVEALLDSSIAIYNKNATEFDPKIENPKSYFKQLIVVINSKGQKEVWVNCFCAASQKSYWKKDIVLVNDGGGCFFNLKINLTTSTVYDFRVNGLG